MSNNLSSQAVRSTIPPIVGRALVVSNDPTISGQLISAMQQFAIAVDVCTNPLIAATLIHTRKFEAIVVDLALGGGEHQFEERAEQAARYSDAGAEDDQEDDDPGRAAAVRNPFREERSCFSDRRRVVIRRTTEW